MLMLRRGGKFTDSRIERHIWSGIIYIVLGVIVFIVVSSFLSMTIGMIAGGALLASALAFVGSHNTATAQSPQTARLLPIYPVDLTWPKKLSKRSPSYGRDLHRLTA